MEDVRRYRNIKLMFDGKEFDKQVKSPLFRAGHIYHSDFAAIELHRRKIKMSKPRYVGKKHA